MHVQNACRGGFTLKASANASIDAAPFSRDSGRDIVFSMFMVFFMELVISASLTIGPGSMASSFGLLPYMESCTQTLVQPSQICLQKRESTVVVLMLIGDTSAIITHGTQKHCHVQSEEGALQCSRQKIEIVKHLILQKFSPVTDSSRREGITAAICSFYGLYCYCLRKSH